MRRRLAEESQPHRRARRVGAVFRKIVPPGAYQPAFFRTEGSGSSSRAAHKPTFASSWLCTQRPTTSHAMALTCLCGSSRRSRRATGRTSSTRGRQVFPLAPVTREGMQRLDPDSGMGVGQHPQEVSERLRVGDMVEHLAALPPHGRILVRESPTDSSETFAWRRDETVVRIDAPVRVGQEADERFEGIAKPFAHGNNDAA